MNKKIEYLIEHGLFASRWLMAPFYIGLAIALIILLIGFIQELYHLFSNISLLSQNEMILGILSLIDLSLAGNLLLIVIFSGYENFVSKMNVNNHEDQPAWQAEVDFSTLKLKLVGSIVAISGIHLLKVFMEIEKFPSQKITFLIIIHLIFVISGVLLAIMDFIAAHSKNIKNKYRDNN